MKTYKLLIAAGLLAFSFNASAVTVSPLTCVEADPDNEFALFNCWTGTDPANLSADQLSDIVFGTGDNAPSLTAYYQADVNFDKDTGTLYPNVETGPYSDVYDTAFSDSESDPADALITFDGDVDTNIFCTDCYLYVKDGNADPAYYIFSLGEWNGTDELILSDFWPVQGAISHVAILGLGDGTRVLCGPEDTGCNVVPIPPAVWLFGSGLIGLVGVARRKV